MSNQSKYGVFLDLPAEEYHKLPGASASILRKFHNSTPAHAKVEIEKPREPNVAMMLGTLAHHHLLEPDNPSPKVAISPEKYPADKGAMNKWTYQATYCKDWRRDRQAEGKMVLTQSDYDDAMGMVKAILLHPVASRYFEEGTPEVSIVSHSKDFGMDVRCRIDWVPKGSRLIDVKTSHDSSPKEWPWICKRMGYRIQAALYLDLFNSHCGSEGIKDGFTFVVVEQSAPYGVMVYNLSAKDIQLGREEYFSYLKTYADCVKTNRWPAYPTEAVALEVP